jgi:Tfp pilus assembly protein FimT
MRKRNGFSILEVTMSVLVGLTLTDMAVRRVAPVQSAVAVISSANTLTSLAARARAHAIERGAIVRLEIDTAEDRASVVVGAEVLESIDFESMGVDIQSESSRVRLCMNPSGFGETGCNSFESDITIKLVRGEKSSAIVLGPLGRVIKL